MQRVLMLTCLSLFILAAPAHGEDEARDPTPSELATMILDGNRAEHDLVAAWLDGASREQLRAVFTRLRGLRELRAERKVTRLEVEPLREVPRVAPAYAGPVMHAEVRILDVPVSAAEAILGTLRPTADKPYVALDSAQVNRIMRAVEKHAGAKIVSAPRVSVQNAQRANVSVLNQVSYVQDYDVEEAKGMRALDPVIGVVQEGILVDFVSTWEPATKSMRVEFEGTFSSLQRPIAEKEIKVPGLEKAVRIQLPEVDVGRIKATLTMPDGGWVLLGGNIRFQLEKDGERVERVALMHIRKRGAAHVVAPAVKGGSRAK